jgi:hypothetical protein
MNLMNSVASSIRGSHGGGDVRDGFMGYDASSYHEDGGSFSEMLVITHNTTRRHGPQNHHGHLLFLSPLQLHSFIFRRLFSEDCCFLFCALFRPPAAAADGFYRCAVDSTEDALGLFAGCDLEGAINMNSVAGTPQAPITT